MCPLRPDRCSLMKLQEREREREREREIERERGRERKFHYYNELIYGGAKLVGDKEHEHKLKTLTRNSTGYAPKKSTTAIKNHIEKGLTLEHVGTKRKKSDTTNKKTNNKLEDINQKVLVKEAKLKKYQDRIKPYRQNRTFQNNEKILPMNRG